MSQLKQEQDRTGLVVACPTMIETYTGRFVNAVDIKPEDVDFRDVVHSLAYTCRYGGHCRRFYSVAEHSIHCHDLAVEMKLSGVVCLAALLHDAGEAYWHDLARPLKVAAGMEVYNRYLDAAQKAVELRAGEIAYTRELVVHAAAINGQKTIKDIDNAVLKAEARWLMLTKGKDWGWLDVIQAAEIPWWKWRWYGLPGRAEAGFLRRLRRYGIR